MNVIPVVDLSDTPDEVGGSLEAAVEKLLAVTERPAIQKWVQFPQALLLFLVIPGDPESGAFYVYDRRSRIWLWVDFEDQNYGGYSVHDFEQLLRECKFLDIVQRPHLLRGQARWRIQPGTRPQPVAEAVDPAAQVPV
jgi:hypothetical protein